MRCTVSLQRCMDGTLHALAFRPTGLAPPAEQRALLYQQPSAVAHPVAPVGRRHPRLLAGNYHFLEGSCHFILLLNGG
jgi:hypothetical protein